MLQRCAAHEALRAAIANQCSDQRFQVLTQDVGRDAIANILGFIGYGNLAAPLWFIGLEEGLGGMDDADVAANLVARGRFDETMDLAQSHMTLVERGRPYDLSQRDRFTPVWLWMARFARAIEGAPDWQDLELAKEYVRNRLGRSDGSTFLTYGSPIPEQGLHTRQWTNLVRQTELEVQGLLDRRVARIRALIELHRPSIVICHGTSATGKYQSLLPAMHWRPIPGGGSFLAAQNERGLRGFITPFFGVGQMSFDKATDLVRVLQEGVQRPPHRFGVEGMNAARHPPATPPKSAVMTGCMPQGMMQLGQAAIDYSDNTDPKCTVRLVNRLEKMGFSNDAFALLHHRREKGERETISGFRSYCANLNGRFRTASNRLVHDRLVQVLKGRLSSIEGSAPPVDFETLADRAYKAIPHR